MPRFVSISLTTTVLNLLKGTTRMETPKSMDIWQNPTCFCTKLYFLESPQHSWQRCLLESLFRTIGNSVQHHRWVFGLFTHMHCLSIVFSVYHSQCLIQGCIYWHDVKRVLISLAVVCIYSCILTQHLMLMGFRLGSCEVFHWWETTAWVHQQL